MHDRDQGSSTRGRSLPPLPSTFPPSMGWWQRLLLWLGGLFIRRAVRQVLPWAGAGAPPETATASIAGGTESGVMPIVPADCPVIALLSDDGGAVFLLNDGLMRTMRLSAKELDGLLPAIVWARATREEENRR